MSRTTVVTGASSFVGHHLVQAFADAGHRVVATISRSLDTYEGIRSERLGRIKTVCDLRVLDVADPKALSNFVAGILPDLWIQHSGFAENYGGFDYDIARAFQVNVRPLPVLYKALAGTKAKVIHTGSSMEYADQTNGDRETDRCLPTTPYGLSKLMQTLTAAQLSEHFGVWTRVARLYIPFGSLDNPAKLLPSVVTALRTGTPIDLSPCTQKRDFIGVSDVRAAYLKLAEDDDPNAFDIFNICAGEATSLRALLETIADRLNADPGLLQFGRREMRSGEPEVSFGNNAHAREHLAWSPKPLLDALDQDLLGT